MKTIKFIFFFFCILLCVNCSGRGNSDSDQSSNNQPLCAETKPDGKKNVDNGTDTMPSNGDDTTAGRDTVNLVQNEKNNDTLMVSESEEGTPVKDGKCGWWLGILLIVAVVVIYRMVKTKGIRKTPVTRVDTKICNQNEVSRIVGSIKKEIQDNKRTIIDEIHQLRSDIADLKKQLPASPQPETAAPKPNGKVEPSNEKKKGFFGNVIGDGSTLFFRDFRSQMKDDNLFSAEVEGGVAEFKPISIGGISQSDTAKKAIETVSGSLRSAKDFQVEKIGRAEKDGDLWIIKEKVKINCK